MSIKDLSNSILEASKSVLELSAIEAGEYYNMRIPIAAEAKDGETWADTH